MLARYRELYTTLQTQAAAEAGQLRQALRWFPRIRPPRFQKARA